MPREVTVRVRAEGVEVATAKVREFGKSFTELEQRLRKTGERLQTAGMNMAIGFTAPIAAAGGAAIKAFLDWETALVGVAKTVDASQEQLAALAQAFVRTSEVVPVSAVQLAQLGQAAGQLGIQIENIEAFTRTIAALGVSTNLSAEQAAMALARIAAITQMPQDQFDRLGSVVVALGNNFATTEAEIVEMSLRLAAAGRQVGLTQAQILALAAALSAVGIQAEAGGTAISRVMAEMASAVAAGGERLVSFARVAGMTTQAFAELFRRDAAAAIIAFIEGLGRLHAAGQNVFAVLEDVAFAEVRVRNALLASAGAGDLMRRAVNLATEAWQENAALTQESEKFYARLAGVLQIVRNRLRNVAAELGAALAPSVREMAGMLMSLLEALRGAVRAFGELPAPIRSGVLALAALVAILGPLAFGLGVFAKGVAGLIPVVRTLTAALVTLQATGFAGLLRFVGPAGLIAGGLATLGMLFVALRSRAREAADGIANDMARVGAAVAQVPEALVGIRAQVLQQRIAQLEAADRRFREFAEAGGQLSRQQVRDWNAVRVALQQLRPEFDALAARLQMLRAVEVEAPRGGAVAAPAGRVGIGLPRLDPRDPEIVRAISEEARRAAESVTRLRVQLGVLGAALRRIDPQSEAFRRLADEAARLRAELEDATQLLRALEQIRREAAMEQLRQLEVRVRLAGVTPEGLVAAPPVPAVMIEPPVPIMEQARMVVEAMRELGLSLSQLAEIPGDHMRVLEAAALSAGISVEALTERLGLMQQRMDETAQIVVGAFGAMAQAAILGSGRIAEAIVRSLTQILQVVAGGGITGAIIGAVGGIFGALFARGRREPQPVRIEDYSARAIQQQKEIEGPVTVTLNIISPETGEIIDVIRYELGRRERRDAVVRLPAMARG